MVGHTGEEKPTGKILFFLHNQDFRGKILPKKVCIYEPTFLFMHKLCPDCLNIP